MLKKRNVNEKSFLYLLLVNIILYTVFFSLFIFVKHFSPDDYNTYWNQDIVALDVLARSYRNCYGLLLAVLDRIHVNVVADQIFFGCILILSFAWCTTVITKEVNRRINKDHDIRILFLVQIGSLLLLSNVFISEWLWFSLGYLQWMISVITMTYGAVALAKKDHFGKNWLIGFLCLLIAAGSYQTILSYYVFLVMFFIFVDEKGAVSKESAAAVLRAAAAAVLSIVVNMLFTYALKAAGIISMETRMDFGWERLGERLRLTADLQKEIWVKGMGLLPEYSAIFVLCILSGILIVTIYHKIGFLSFVYILVVLVSGQSVMYMPELMSGEWSVRMFAPVFGVYTILIWMICYYAKYNGRASSFCRCAALIVSALFFLINIIGIQSNALDAVRTNVLDKYCIRQIGDYISWYEQNSNMTVQFVGFCYDAAPTYKYHKYIDNEGGDLSIRAFAQIWSQLAALNFYTNRNFEGIAVPEETAAGIAVQNWEKLDLDQQIIFDGDKVYICVY